MKFSEVQAAGDFYRLGLVLIYGCYSWCGGTVSSGPKIEFGVLRVKWNGKEVYVICGGVRKRLFTPYFN